MLTERSWPPWFVIVGIHVMPTITNPAEGTPPKITPRSPRSTRFEASKSGPRPMGRAYIGGTMQEPLPPNRPCVEQDTRRQVVVPDGNDWLGAPATRGETGFATMDDRDEA